MALPNQAFALPDLGLVKIIKIRFHSKMGKNVVITTNLTHLPPLLVLFGDGHGQ